MRSDPRLKVKDVDKYMRQFYNIGVRMLKVKNSGANKARKYYVAFWPFGLYNAMHFNSIKEVARHLGYGGKP